LTGPTGPTGPSKLVAHLLLLGAVALLWSMLAGQPLWHTDLWGHLAYGRWMIQHDGQIPLAEPFLPYADDNLLVDTAHLSQLIGYRVMRAGGVEALQLLYATLVTGCALLSVAPVLASRCPRRIAASIAGAAIFLAVAWQQLEIMRPQLAGLACFTGLLALLHDPRPSWWRMVLVGVVMAAWANLHGSFVIGWLLLATHLIGRVIDRIARTRRRGAWRHDRQLAHRLRQATLGVLVPLVATPYGTSLPWQAWQIGRHPNLADIIEWQPLGWDTAQASAMLAAAVLIGSLAIIGRRRVRSYAWLMLITTGVATVACSRMINWWAPVAGLVVALQATALSSRLGLSQPLPPADRRKVLVGAVVMTLVTLIASPAARGLLVERDTLVARRPMVSSATPLEATAWLLEHPPQGMVLASYEWGDFLIWQGPPRIQLLVASHAHLVPETAWRDYIEVIGVATDWSQRLDRHNIQTLVLDRHRQAGLIAALEDDPGWQQDYSDALAEVWSRKQ
jgi:hypothetical protein